MRSPPGSTAEDTRERGPQRSVVQYAGVVVLLDTEKEVGSTGHACCRNSAYWTAAQVPRPHLCVYKYVCMYVCMNVCMHACMYVCMNACMHVFTHVCMDGCL